MNGDPHVVVALNVEICLVYHLFPHITETVVSSSDIWWLDNTGDDGNILSVFGRPDELGS